MPDIAIKIQNLTKSYKLYNRHIERLKESLHPLGKKYHRPFYALNDVSFEVPKGEIMGIVGRNGAGKSTLLNIIAGVSTPSSGQVNVNGKVSALLELGTGFNPEMSGIENIYFHGTIKGYSKEEMDGKLDDILSFTDIGEFINQPLKTYSSGMRARLGFAVAINIDPEILIIDEVLAVGDELFKRKCYARMEALFNSGCTVLFVSHSISTINEICTHAVFLDKGELLLKGPTKLVTMFYQKFLFSKSENIAKLKNEILMLNQNEHQKRAFSQNPEKIETTTIPNDKNDDNLKAVAYENRQTPFFMPNFEPKSTVQFKNSNVHIDDIHIKTLDGRRVNALVTNDEYILSYKVKFNRKHENVFSNIIFKTEKGFRLGSDVAPGRDKFLEGVMKGAAYLFEWRFRCSLLVGNYYVNVAVRSYLNGEYSFLNRIEDALVFKVQKNPGLTCKGIIHLDQHAEITLLDEENS